MAIKLMYILNDEHKITLLIDNNCWLKHLDSSQSCKVNEKENVILKLWELVFMGSTAPRKS